MRVRSGLITLIYRKALLLSNDERASRPTGEIVNLVSVDATRLQDLCTYGLIAISGPFQVRFCDSGRKPLTMFCTDYTRTSLAVQPDGSSDVLWSGGHDIFDSTKYAHGPEAQKSE